MQVDLSGKTALITGGSRGIGRAIALELARLGADICFCYYRNRKAADETAKAIEDLGRSAHVLQANVADREDLDGLFDAVGERFGHLDIFVSNAVSSTLRPLAELPDRHWEHILDANLSSLFFGARRAMQLMAGRKGRILAISSIGSRLCLPGYGALSVAKAGIETLVRCLAVEWADRGISVNAVCGGPVDTKALEAFRGGGYDLEMLKAALVSRTPLKRLGRPEDIAGVVAFLCSDAADWIRGQTLVVDGGLTSVGHLERHAP